MKGVLRAVALLLVVALIGGYVYATADIIEYGGKSSVKVGREFLLRKNQ